VRLLIRRAECRTSGSGKKKLDALSFTKHQDSHISSYCTNPEDASPVHTALDQCNAQLSFEREIAQQLIIGKDELYARLAEANENVQGANVVVVYRESM
jgi:hypothetical protein